MYYGEGRKRRPGNTFFINTMAREDLTEKGVTEQILESVRNQPLGRSGGQNVVDRKQSVCKGPETDTHLDCPRESKKASVAGAEGVSRRV